MYKFSDYRIAHQSFNLLAHLTLNKLKASMAIFPMHILYNIRYGGCSGRDLS